MTEPKTCWESFKVDGTAIVDKIKDLIRAGNVRRVIVEHDGRTIAEFPVTVGVIGVVVAPIAAALGRLTAHNAQGRSYIIKDDRITTGPFPSLYKATGDMPLGPAPAGEPQKIMATDAPQLEPALGGSSFTFVTLPPTPRGAKPGWHRTMTLDYNILLGGDLVLMVDEGETLLHPGDVVIQRNTLHAWRNDTKSPVYWVAVLVPINRQP